MNGQIDITERSIETSVGTTYCRLVAGPPSTRPPLIVVHGGPGFTWNYLGELDQLAAAGQPVIYYDQLGNGLSGSPPGGAEAISLAVLCQQLRDVVSALIGDGRYFLLGHSAGSVVALEHALENPPGLAGLVIANGGAAARDVADSIWRCRRNLPAAMQIALDRGDADGNTTSDAYNAAIGEFFQRHVCRTATMPAGLQHALAALGRNPQVYVKLWGPDSFHLVGELSGWSAIERLHAVTVPTLVYRGEYDEADDLCMQPLVAGIPGAVGQVIPDTSHMTHAERPEACCALIDSFLAPLHV